MSDIPAGLRTLVVARAGNRCEYCQLSQVGQEATFHIDHVQPRSAAGPTSPENLALACVSCSLRKGSQTTALEFDSQAEVPLFNPRVDEWDVHFEWNGDIVVARTTIGKATIAALALNRPLIRGIRQEEAMRGRHPPRKG